MSLICNNAHENVMGVALCFILSLKHKGNGCGEECLSSLGTADTFNF